MQDTTCLSVIVPMYNVEKYLSLCLDSLFRTEGIEDTEIILIDDGSSDRTREIADGYAAKHPNITVLHQDNKGPSAARNLGISKACGRYIFFCDSDDEVDPEAVEQQVRNSGQCDARFAKAHVQQHGSEGMVLDIVDCIPLVLMRFVFHQVSLQSAQGHQGHIP